jgi:hypothetical protein
MPTPQIAATQNRMAGQRVHPGTAIAGRSWARTRAATESNIARTILPYLAVPNVQAVRCSVASGVAPAVSSAHSINVSFGALLYPRLF